MDDNSDPIWEEKLHFTLGAMQFGLQPLSFLVFDEDMFGRKETLGFATLTMKELLMH